MSSLVSSVIITRVQSSVPVGDSSLPREQVGPTSTSFYIEVTMISTFSMDENARNHKCHISKLVVS